jgi:MOSC domain-containing protein YiiM
MSTGKLRAIWIKRAKWGPMDAVEKAELIAGRGLVGNANQGGRRQVTIIEEEIWQSVMKNLKGTLSPSARRANLLVQGISLANSRGRILQIGECSIRIFGETRPCERMDAALQGLREALQPNWGGGAFGEVLNDGRISVGDEIRWLADLMEREGE